MTNEKLIIAHRGASAYEKENTIEAFQKAVEFGANYLEFDIRKTSDNIFVAYHDPMIGGNKISEISYGVLQNLSEKKGIKIPMLNEIVSSVDDSISFDVHLKDKNIVLEVVEKLLELVGEERLIFTSE